MVSVNRPTIVFVPGAWHSPSCFEPLPKLLYAEKYEVVGVTLPSVGAEPPVSSFDPDVAAIRETVLSILELGKDVVLAVHSYGAIPTSEAVKGLGLQDRFQEGKKGAVLRIIYIAAIVAHEGDTAATSQRSRRSGKNYIDRDVNLHN